MKTREERIDDLRAAKKAAEALWRRAARAEARVSLLLRELWLKEVPP